MYTFIHCLLGPQLYRLYKLENRRGKDYVPTVFELCSDVYIQTVSYFLSMFWGVYASPLLVSFLCYIGCFSSKGLIILYWLSSTMGLLFFVTVLIRGIARFRNPEYVTFIGILAAYKKEKSRDLKMQVGRYDFDFRHWPIDFRWDENTVNFSPKVYVESTYNRKGLVKKLTSFPSDVLSYIAIHAVGRLMIYPGSFGVLNIFLSPMLLRGRSKLVEEHMGLRFKLLSKDGNEIDSMFIDRRNDASFPNGNFLVIQCQGNGAFYEHGCSDAPLEAGFSILGWNHPGFGYSTGSPFPDQEVNAVNVVMQLAVSKLGFKIEEVVIFGWSIGGYTATWAAMNYPKIKGLILDSTFDDLVPVAISKLPKSWKRLVEKTIRDYMNLNNAEQLCKYPGPVSLVRRRYDETVATKASSSIQTNRGNYLLIKLLQSRYPQVLNEKSLHIIEEVLTGDKLMQDIFIAMVGNDDQLYNSKLLSYVEENNCNEFPLNIGEDFSDDMKIKFISFLASKHMIDFDSTHCVPLPGRLFQLPWEFRLSSVNISCA